MTRVLLIEDDRALTQGLCKLLRDSGYAVDAFDHGEAALQIVDEEPYALVILDIGLPDISGFDWLLAARRRNISTPVLMLTAQQAMEDRVRGLDQGADDYLTKPFDAAELLARARALIRRGSGAASPLIVIGSLECNLSAGMALLAGQPLDLRRREWAVLVALASRAGKVVPKDRLVAEIFGYEDPVSPNAVEVYVTRLRKKLGDGGPIIRNLRGLGYMMETA